MNGKGNFSNCSFNHENSWFEGRPKPSVSRVDIENDLYRGNTSPNFLSACSSFLQLRLQERIRNEKLSATSSTSPPFHVNSTSSTTTSNFKSCSVLKFANSCIQLQNVENYSHHIENETTNADTLHIDEILPNPEKESNSNIFYASFLSNLRNKFMKFKNIFKRKVIVAKKSHQDMKKLKLVTQGTQTDLCSRKFKHVKKPASGSTLLKGKSSRMLPEDVKEYQCWKANFSNEKTKRQRIYKCPMAKCNSCMEVVETKVQTKKFTKMRKQSSKLSVLNENREYDDEFEAYWRQVKLKNPRRF